MPTLSSSRGNLDLPRGFHSPVDLNLRSSHVSMNASSYHALCKKAASNFAVESPAASSTCPLTLSCWWSFVPQLQNIHLQQILQNDISVSLTCFTDVVGVQSEAPIHSGVQGVLGGEGSPYIPLHNQNLLLVMSVDTENSKGGEDDTSWISDFGLGYLKVPVFCDWGRVAMFASWQATVKVVTCE